MCVRDLCLSDICQKIGNKIGKKTTMAIAKRSASIDKMWDSKTDKRQVRRDIKISETRYKWQKPGDKIQGKDTTYFTVNACGLAIFFFKILTSLVLQ